MCVLWRAGGVLRVPQYCMRGARHFFSAYLWSTLSSTNYQTSVSMEQSSPFDFTCLAKHFLPCLVDHWPSQLAMLFLTRSYKQIPNSSWKIGKLKGFHLQSFTGVKSKMPEALKHEGLILAGTAYSTGLRPFGLRVPTVFDLPPRYLMHAQGTRKVTKPNIVPFTLY